MYCARCNQAILPGEDYEEQYRESISGPGRTAHVHKPRCPQPWERS